MKNIFFMTVAALCFTPQFSYAHDMKDPGCKALHEACEKANHKGKESHKCMHSMMDGEPVEGVTQDLAESIKTCKAAHEMHGKHHDNEKAPAQPESN